MEKKEEKKTISIKPIEIRKNRSTFPKLKIGFSIIITALAVADITGLYGISRLLLDILLLISGLWLLESSIISGFNKSHREILKRYI